MAGTIVAAVLVILTVTWISVDYVRSKRRLDKASAEVLASCQETREHKSGTYCTRDVDLNLTAKVRELKESANTPQREPTPSGATPLPPNDSQILKVITDKTNDLKKAARERVAKRS